MKKITLSALLITCLLAAAPVTTYATGSGSGGATQDPCATPTPPAGGE